MSPFRSGLIHWWQGVVGRPVENRRVPRSSFRSWVEIRVRGGESIRGVARDLSAGGISVILQAELNIGESVLIKYDHPKSPEVTQLVGRRAIVRSRYGYRYGFEFDHAMDFWANAE